MCFYVDYMLILSSNEHVIKYAKNLLTNKYDMLQISYYEYKFLKHLMDWYCFNLTC
jgi:hypothetical protein